MRRQGYIVMCVWEVSVQRCHLDKLIFPELQNYNHFFDLATTKRKPTYFLKHNLNFLKSGISVSVVQVYVPGGPVKEALSTLKALKFRKFCHHSA